MITYFNQIGNMIPSFNGISNITNMIASFNKISNIANMIALQSDQ